MRPSTEDPRGTKVPRKGLSAWSSGGVWPRTWSALNTRTKKNAEARRSVRQAKGMEVGRSVGRNVIRMKARTYLDLCVFVLSSVRTGVEFNSCTLAV